MSSNETEQTKNNMPGDDPPNSVPLPISKTPLYQALNAARYNRQLLIKQINEKTGRVLICFVCAPGALINRDDTLGFVEMLHNVPPNSDVDLLLHTPGGDIDAAEKLISLVHKKVGTGKQLRVIVPDFAKSAGTLMTLGAHKIVMSDSSELGPIDPQVSIDDGRGNRLNHSVLSFLDAYQQHADELKNNPNDPVARMMLEKLDPATIKVFEQVRHRARAFAEDQLNRWMQPTRETFSKIASDLMDVARWQSHGQMISSQDAEQLGLEVEHLAPTDELWRMYWQLYCHQRLALKDRERLFETDYASAVL
ncbi:MAG TPA: hypothetical protein VMU87_12545 [Stellaceae bacterium]|nr:hypothetical protein [Stellaceae bacterium]